jgi:putative chitinase
VITADQFRHLFPGNKEPDAWAAALNAILPKWHIDNERRIAQFLAQVGHESEDFTSMRENLNYSAEALAATWPKRYAVEPTSKLKLPNDLAKRLARKPEAIANNVYANRMGNGPEESGDGWKHRGRGGLQVTGKDNYIAFAKASGIPYDDVFAYLETKEGAVESACWYWANNGLNTQADMERTEIATRLINGGLIGLADRKTRYAAARAIFTA